MLWVIPSIDPGMGGPSTTAVNSITADARAGINVTLAFTATQEGLQQLKPVLDDLLSDGVEILAFPRASERHWAGVWGVSFPLLRWLSSHVREFDLVSLQYIWAATSLVGSVAAKLKGIPSTLTPHESLTSFDIDVTSGRQSKRLAKLALRAVVLRCVDLVQFNSEMERRDSKVLDRNQTEIVNFPVIEEVPEPSLRTRSEDPQFRVGFLGRLHPKKNVDLLVEALSRLDDHFELVIAGSGDSDQTEALKELAKELGVGHRVDWLGHVDRAQRSRFFADIDLLAMPSRYESFGMVAAEAMAEGVPVISTPNAGVSEIIRAFNAGVVLDEVSPDLLANAIAELDEDRDLLSSFASRGQIAVRDRLTYSSYGIKIRSVYASIAEPEAVERFG
ncbi:MAG: glycosyltransferase [Thermoleophilales bacterium]|nr:glycosyltransferase [Thermoleophilales bacterium]